MNDLIEERDKSMGRESEKSVEGEREKESSIMLGVERELLRSEGKAR